MVLAQPPGHFRCPAGAPTRPPINRFSFVLQLGSPHDAALPAPASAVHLPHASSVPALPLPAFVPRTIPLVPLDNPGCSPTGRYKIFHAAARFHSPPALSRLCSPGTALPAGHASASKNSSPRRIIRQSCSWLGHSLVQRRQCPLEGIVRRLDPRVAQIILRRFCEGKKWRERHHPRHFQRLASPWISRNQYRAVHRPRYNRKPPQPWNCQNQVQLAIQTHVPRILQAIPRHRLLQRQQTCRLFHIRYPLGRGKKLFQLLRIGRYLHRHKPIPTIDLPTDNAPDTLWVRVHLYAPPDRITVPRHPVAVSSSPSPAGTDKPGKSATHPANP